MARQGQMLHLTAEGIGEARTEVGQLGLLLQERMWRKVGEGVKKEVKSLLNETVEHFVHDVPYNETLHVTKGGFRYHMQVTDPVWNILDLGAPKHLITPREATNLVFKSGPRQAKTVVGRIRTQPGFSAQGPNVVTQEVMHPGFPPRMWTDLIILLATDYSERTFMSTLDKFLNMMKYVQNRSTTTSGSSSGTPARPGTMIQR